MKNTVRLIIQRYKARRDIKSAFGTKNPIVARALEQSLEALPGSARMVEARRAALLRDGRTVKLIDFGAGDHSNPGDSNGAVIDRKLSDITAKASKSAPWAMVLHELARVTKPQCAIEMGSCVGISASYIASALKANGTGKLYTLEGDPTLAGIALETLSSLSLQDVAEVVTGRFADTLDVVLSKAPQVGFAFIDGHHDGDATVAYFQKLLPHTKRGSILVFDDVTWSDSMKRGWAAIKRSPSVSEAVDLGAMGLVIVH